MSQLTVQPVVPHAGLDITQLSNSSKWCFLRWLPSIHSMDGRRHGIEETPGNILMNE